MCSMQTKKDRRSKATAKGAICLFKAVVTLNASVPVGLGFRVWGLGFRVFGLGFNGSVCATRAAEHPPVLGDKSKHMLQGFRV